MTCLVLVGCSSSNDENPASNLLVKTAELRYSPTDFELLEYSYEGTKLKTVKRIGDLYIEFSYINDQLTRIDYPITGQYYILEYNASGKVTQFTKYYSSNFIEERAEITYSANNFTRTFYTGNTGQNFVGTEVVTITDGNVMTVARSFGLGYQETTTYTYDNKNNPFKNISSFDVFKILEIADITGTANNLTSWQSTMSNYPYTKAFTYNEFNFPITEKKIYGAFVDNTLTYTYFE